MQAEQGKLMIAALCVSLRRTLSGRRAPWVRGSACPSSAALQSLQLTPPCAQPGVLPPAAESAGCAAQSPPALPPPPPPPSSPPAP
eukprot:5814048-Pleurochrysis_carterae.AAC.1